jgi:hypothetical protein
MVRASGVRQRDPLTCSVGKAAERSVSNVSGPQPIPSPGLGYESRNESGGLTGAVIAVVLLALGSGAGALFCLFVLPFASDICGDAATDFICTAAGQDVVAAGPLLTAVAGTVVAGSSCSMRPRNRALGIALGYAIAIGGFMTAMIIASQV